MANLVETAGMFRSGPGLTGGTNAIADNVA